MVDFGENGASSNGASQKMKDQLFAKAMGVRFALAMKRRKRAIQQGDKYVKMMQGATTVDPNENDENTWSKSGIPLLYMWKEALLPAILDRFPKFVGKAKRKASQITYKRIKLIEDFSDYLWRELDLQYVVKYAANDTLPFGVGCAEVFMDKKRNVPSACAIHIKDVLVDAEANSPSIKDVRWVAVKETMPLVTAMRKWPEYKDRLEANTDEFASDKDEEIDVEDVRKGESGMGGSDNPAMRSDRIELWKVYIKGDNPSTPEGDITSKTTIEKEEDEVYRGKNEIAWLYPTGGAKAGMGANYILLERKPDENGGVWDLEDFPVEFMRITMDCRSFWPPSFFDPVVSIAEQANWAVTYDNTDAKMSVQRKIIIDKTKFDKEQKAQLMSDANLEVIWANDSAAVQGIQVIEYKGGNTAAAQNAIVNIERFKEATALNELIMEGRSHETATGAALRDKRTQLRTGGPALEIERFSINIIRKMIQLAMSTMSAEDMAKAIGPELLELYPEQVIDKKTRQPVFDENGLPKMRMVSDIWPEMDTEAIRREVEINIEQESMRRVSRDQQAAELAQLKQSVIQSIAAMKEQGIQIKGDVLSETLFGIDVKFAELLGVTNFREVIPEAKDLIQVPMEVPEGATATNLGGGGGQMPPQEPMPQEVAAMGQQPF